jgi:glycosyltransferase involved in cell wall biosynthesis
MNPSAAKSGASEVTMGATPPRFDIHKQTDLVTCRLVHGIGWVDGPFGYNVHARNFFSALARRIPTIVTPLVGRQGPLVKDRRLVRRIRDDGEIVSIALLYGNLAGEMLEHAPGARIIYTVWESTRLPDDWIPALNIADQVWTPSHWGAAVMARNGIDPARIHVVPEGVDPVLFNPDIPATGVIAGEPGYKFLNIGRFEDRKGTATLIRAFDEEFGTKDDAILVLACHNHHQENFDIGAELRSLGLRHPDKLKFIPPVARHDILAALYTACDAFVAPSRAEGWGLPIIEAMACDLPVIATGHSAPLDFLGPEAFRLPAAMVPIQTSFFEASDGDFGMWAEPDRAELRHLLREVYENREAAKAAGQNAGRRIRANFTWDGAASRAIDALAGLR